MKDYLFGKGQIIPRPLFPLFGKVAVERKEKEQKEGKQKGHDDKIVRGKKGRDDKAREQKIEDGAVGHADEDQLAVQFGIRGKQVHQPRIPDHHGYADQDDPPRFFDLEVADVGQHQHGAEIERVMIDDRHDEEENGFFHPAVDKGVRRDPGRDGIEHTGQKAAKSAESVDFFDTENGRKTEQKVTDRGKLDRDLKMLPHRLPIDIFGGLVQNEVTSNPVCDLIRQFRFVSQSENDDVQADEQ